MNPLHIIGAPALDLGGYPSKGLQQGPVSVGVEGFKGLVYGYGPACGGGFAPEKPVEIVVPAFLEQGPQVRGPLAAGLVNRGFTHSQELGKSLIRFQPLFLANPVKNRVYVGERNCLSPLDIG